MFRKNVTVLGYYSTGVFYLVKSVFEVTPMVATNFAYVYVINIYDDIVVNSFGSSLYWPLFALMSLAEISIVSMAHAFTLLGGGNLKITVLLACISFTFFLLIGKFILKK